MKMLYLFIVIRYCYVMSYLDEFSKFIMLEALTSKKAVEVAKNIIKMYN